MNPEQCEFLAENELIQIISNFNEDVLHFVCGEVGPFEAGITTSVPIWLAIHLRKRHKCTIVPPAWMSVEELKKLLVAEGERTIFSELPKCFFEIARIILLNAKEDIEQMDQVRTLVKDIWDKREAKMKTSTIKFLSQHEVSHAQLDNLSQLEIAYARPIITESTRRIQSLGGVLRDVVRR